MKIYATAYIDSTDNDLKISFHEAASPYDAIRLMLTEYHSDPEAADWIRSLPDDLTQMKIEAFNSDMMIDVKEVPVSPLNL